MTLKNSEAEVLHGRIDGLSRTVSKRDTTIAALVESNKGLADRLAQVLAQVGTLNEKVEALTKAQAAGAISNTVKPAAVQPAYQPNGPGANNGSGLSPASFNNFRHIRLFGSHQRILARCAISAPSVSGSRSAIAARVSVLAARIPPRRNSGSPQPVVHVRRNWRLKPPRRGRTLGEEIQRACVTQYQGARSGVRATPSLGQAKIMRQNVARPAIGHSRPYSASPGWATRLCRDLPASARAPGAASRLQALAVIKPWCAADQLAGGRISHTRNADLRGRLAGCR